MDNSKSLISDLAKLETPSAESGMWTLTSPSGKVWRRENPMSCCAAELASRVPDDVMVARIAVGMTADQGEDWERLSDTELLSWFELNQLAWWLDNGKTWVEWSVDCDCKSIHQTSGDSLREAIGRASLGEIHN